MPSTTKINIEPNTKFGRWMVLSPAGARLHTKSHPALWNCVCHCGTRRVIAGTDLRCGNTRSCGCVNRINARALGKRYVGPKHANWKGGRTTTGKGYVLMARSLVRQEYPDAVMDDKRHKRGMMEHIAAMSHHLKRLILPGETVHHRDGNPKNNDISNLELRVGNHGPGQSIDDAVEWATELLRRYAPHRLL